MYDHTAVILLIEGASFITWKYLHSIETGFFEYGHHLVMFEIEDFLSGHFRNPLIIMFLEGGHHQSR